MKSRLEQVLARRIREVAKAKGLALSHLADRAGIARSYLWLLLDGESSATLETIQRLADVLDVEALELLRPATSQPARLAAASAGEKSGQARRRKKRQ